MSLKTTNYSRIPLIAKWYLGGPLTNFRMTKWSMDDMSLAGLCQRGSVVMFCAPNAKILTEV